MSEKLKKILKIIALPFTALITFILTALCLKSKQPKSAIKKEISNVNKDISRIEKDVKSTEEAFDKKKAELDDSVKKTEDTIQSNLSDKQTRDEAAKKFFK